jgi:hypothetical protein
MKSPYTKMHPDKWSHVTRKLIDEHPLQMDEIVDIVLTSWESTFSSNLGTKGFKIGVNIFPKPQIMGFLLHELIPLELSVRYPKLWRTEETSEDKDIVFIPDDRFSIELKTSSSPRRIFGNRSYVQDSTKGKKAKTGYYLAINFHKFIEKKTRPKIKLIRFGWIDSTDWIGQKAATGQQSRLPTEVENSKLLEIYPSKFK